MNKIFNSRNIAIAVITLAIGIFVALGASKLFFNSSMTVSGNVVSFILNPEGRVDGAILDTGDQVKFGAETGEVVTANVQIGAPLTATGHAGTKSDYGREFHAETLQIGDQTITITGKPKGPKGDKPKGPKGKKGPKDGDRPMPPNAENNDENPLPPNGETAPEANLPQPETATVNGTVKYVLVNKDGNPRGLILANGEQLNLGKEVEAAELSFDTNTSVNATGEIAKSQFGTFVRPKVYHPPNCQAVKGVTLWSRIVPEGGFLCAAVCLFVFGGEAAIRAQQDAALLAKNEIIGEGIETEAVKPILVSVLPKYYSQRSREF